MAVAISSAGLTKSYSEPVPAGFLLIDMRTANDVAAKDPIIDGVVCISRQGTLSILSDSSSGARRAAKHVDSCTSGFQAGPVRIERSIAVTSEHKLNVTRVALAVASDRKTSLVSSSRATTAALACALTSRLIGSSAAISLQGDSLGGVALGPLFDKADISIRLGNVDATVASAFVVEARSRYGSLPSRQRKQICHFADTNMARR